MQNKPLRITSATRWSAFVYHECTNCKYSWYARMYDRAGRQGYFDEKDRHCDACGAAGSLPRDVGQP